MREVIGPGLGVVVHIVGAFKLGTDDVVGIEHRQQFLGDELFPDALNQGTHILIVSLHRAALVQFGITGMCAQPHQLEPLGKPIHASNAWLSLVGQSPLLLADT